MAVTETDRAKTGTTEWAIYAALKQGGTLMSTEGLDNLVEATWESLPDSRSIKHVSVNLSVWISDSTGLVLIGLDGDLSIPATATAEGVICVADMSSVTLAVGFELLGISGDGLVLASSPSRDAKVVFTALNYALEDWANNLKAALEH